MEFKPQKTMFGNTNWICEGPPFAVVRADGSIYLSGNYTLEELGMVVLFVANLPNGMHATAEPSLLAQGSLFIDDASGGA